MAKKPSDATGIIALYNAKSETLPSIPEWRMPKQDWQMKLMAQFEHPTNEHNGRKVFWYYDEIGGTGKSVLADYLAITEPQKWFTTGAFGNAKDASPNHNQCHLIRMEWTWYYHRPTQTSRIQRWILSSHRRLEKRSNHFPKVLRESEISWRNSSRHCIRQLEAQL